MTNEHRRGVARGRLRASTAGLLALLALGCGEGHAALDTLELTEGAQLEALHIDRVRVFRFEAPEHPADHDQAYVASVGEDQIARGLWITLQQPAWGYSDVLYCEGSSFGDPVCDRFPIDADGDGYTDHRIERVPDGDTEIVHVWARFADDGAGPSEVRATFRYDPASAEVIPLTFPEG